MRPIPQISEAELEVMKIIWEMGSATSAQIIEKLLQSTEWKPKTIQTLISRLVSKGAVKSENAGNKAFIYTALIEEGQYKAYANNTFLHKLYNGSINMMLASFIKDQKLSKEELENLKKLLEEEV